MAVARAFIIIIPIICALAGGCATTVTCERTTVRGVAEESKAGLVVNGVMITGLDQSDMDRFRGREVQATGCIERDHPFRIDPSDPVKRQGFDMPVLTRVTSIVIIGK